MTTEEKDTQNSKLDQRYLDTLPGQEGSQLKSSDEVPPDPGSEDDAEDDFTDRLIAEEAPIALGEENPGNAKEPSWAPEPEPSAEEETWGEDAVLKQAGLDLAAALGSGGERDSLLAENT
mgnify:CR=1 FL=1